MIPVVVAPVLPDSKEEAESKREIALAMGIEIATHMDWVRLGQKWLEHWAL